MEGFIEKLGIAKGFYDAQLNFQVLKWTFVCLIFMKVVNP